MASSGKVTLLNETAAAASKTGLIVSIPPRSKKFAGVISTANQDVATTVTGKIEHSADKTVWFDLFSFTAITGAATGKEIKLPTGDVVLQHVRGSATIAGGGPLADVKIELHYEEK